jgi:hypothetical protein
LFQIGLAANCLGLLPDVLQRRYEDRHEKGDDGDDHQEFDQGERSLSGHGVSLSPCPPAYSELDTRIQVPDRESKRWVLGGTSCRLPSFPRRKGTY